MGYFLILSRYSCNVLGAPGGGGGLNVFGFLPVRTPGKPIGGKSGGGGILISGGSRSLTDPSGRII